MSTSTLPAPIPSIPRWLIHRRVESLMNIACFFLLALGWAWVPADGGITALHVDLGDQLALAVAYWKANKLTGLGVVIVTVLMTLLPDNVWRRVLKMCGLELPMTAAGADGAESSRSLGLASVAVMAFVLCALGSPALAVITHVTWWPWLFLILPPVYITAGILQEREKHPNPALALKPAFQVSETYIPTSADSSVVHDRQIEAAQMAVAKYKEIDDKHGYLSDELRSYLRDGNAKGAIAGPLEWSGLKHLFHGLSRAVGHTEPDGKRIVLLETMNVALAEVLSLPALRGLPVVYADIEPPEVIERLGQHDRRLKIEFADLGAQNGSKEREAWWNAAMAGTGDIENRFIEQIKADATKTKAKHYVLVLSRVLSHCGRRIDVVKLRERIEGELQLKVTLVVIGTQSLGNDAEIKSVIDGAHFYIGSSSFWLRGNPTLGIVYLGGKFEGDIGPTVDLLGLGRPHATLAKLDKFLNPMEPIKPGETLIREALDRHISLAVSLEKMAAATPDHLDFMVKISEHSRTLARKFASELRSRLPGSRHFQLLLPDEDEPKTGIVSLVWRTPELAEAARKWLVACEKQPNRLVPTITRFGFQGFHEGSYPVYVVDVIANMVAEFDKHDATAHGDASVPVS